MKYNIYSPLGRTGSVRLLNIINWDFSLTGREHFLETGEWLHESLHISETDTPGTIMQIANYTGSLPTVSLQILEEVKQQNSNKSWVTNHSYVFPESFYELSKKYISLHSHACTWAVKDDWTNILTTRKNKSELPMSLRIAERTGFWTQNDEIDDPHRTENTWYSDRPFHYPVDQYITTLDLLNLKEQMFIEGVKRDTGKDAIISYLEESYEDLEIKFDVRIDAKFREQMDNKISKRRPKDYVVNYDELINAYDKYQYQLNAS